MNLINQKYIIVKQIASAIRRPANQEKILVGLGLNKINRSRKLIDTPSIRGMIHKIKHLVVVEEQ